MSFGQAIRSHWLLDEEVIFLNHGSFGATPKTVLETQQAWRSELERQPVYFMRSMLPQALRSATEALAEFVGADPDDLVFVENATTGVNAVVQSLALQPGDEIVTTNHCYGAVRQTLKYICQRTGAHLIEIPLPFPIQHPDQVLDAFVAGLGSRTRLAVIDHITSPTALILPIEAMIQQCHERGILVLVDGAHALGTVPLNLNTLGADAYTGNAHKWLCAPKGCAFLWVSRALQPQIHPTVISHGLGSGFQTEFSWTGTRDPSAWLAITEALEFQQRLGIQRIRNYNHQMLIDAAMDLAERCQGSLAAPESMLGFMATIPLQGLGFPKATDLSLEQEAVQLHDHLWEEHRIEVPIIPFQDQLWIRISAQVYNYPEEYRQLGQILQDLEH